MKSRIPDGHWLITRACAHRGLHGNDVPENSIFAFEKAIENGYPIETDVQLTKDLVPVCFHDDHLDRMTGFSSRIWDVDYADLQKLRLANSEQKIPTFEEFLKLVDGKVPILIEIKTQPHNKEVCQKVVDLLKGYKGEFAIQSFDPRVMGEIKKLNPEILRGQLMDKDRHEGVSWLVDFMLSNGFLNFLSKPDFINVNHKYLPLGKRLARGKKVLCWTVRCQEEEQKALPFVQGYVFENITPKLK